MFLNALSRIGVFEIFTSLGSVTNKGSIHDQSHTQSSSFIYHLKGINISYNKQKTEIKNIEP
jgi:hypothetical protein